MAKIQEDQIKALKSGNKEELDTLRYVLSELKNKEIDKRKELTDEDVVGVLRKMTRELSESAEKFESGGRGELAQSYKKQLEVIKKYLPEEIADEELIRLVDGVIAANQELFDKNPKAVIGIVIRELKDKADSSRIVALVNKKIAAV